MAQPANNVVHNQQDGRLHDTSMPCETLLAKAREIGPLLAEYADYADENLKLADPVIEALIERSLLRSDSSRPTNPDTSTFRISTLSLWIVCSNSSASIPRRSTTTRTRSRSSGCRSSTSYRDFLFIKIATIIKDLSLIHI